MPKEFIMRGRTPSGETEILNMTGFRPGYGYVLTEFSLFPSTNIGNTHYEIVGTVTADNIAVGPSNPDFNHEGLIATAMFNDGDSPVYPQAAYSVINDLFVITQDLILMVLDTDTSTPINWQVRFKEVKLSSSAEAVANYKQYTIYNTSS